MQDVYIGGVDALNYAYLLKNTEGTKTYPLQILKSFLFLVSRRRYSPSSTFISRHYVMFVLLEAAKIKKKILGLSLEFLERPRNMIIWCQFDTKVVNLR